LVEHGPVTLKIPHDDADPHHVSQRRERRPGSPRDWRRSEPHIRTTTPPTASAGLVLDQRRARDRRAATFSALAVIPPLFLVQLAVIVAGGVLIDTFVVRSLQVPGVIHDIGRATWWPWARRVVREDDGGGEPAERPVPDCASVPAHPD
jgi:hypothetical protein